MNCLVWDALQKHLDSCRSQCRVLHISGVPSTLHRAIIPSLIIQSSQKHAYSRAKRPRVQLASNADAYFVLPSQMRRVKNCGFQVNGFQGLSDSGPNMDFSAVPRSSQHGHRREHATDSGFYDQSKALSLYQEQLPDDI